MLPYNENPYGPKYDPDMLDVVQKVVAGSGLTFSSHIAGLTQDLIVRMSAWGRDTTGNDDLRATKLAFYEMAARQVLAKQKENSEKLKEDIKQRDARNEKILAEDRNRRLLNKPTPTPHRPAPPKRPAPVPFSQRPNLFNPKPVQPPAPVRPQRAMVPYVPPKPVNQTRPLRPIVVRR